LCSRPANTTEKEIITMLFRLFTSVVTGGASELLRGVIKGGVGSAMARDRRVIVAEQKAAERAVTREAAKQQAQQDIIARRDRLKSGTATTGDKVHRASHIVAWTNLFIIFIPILAILAVLVTA
jgi:hypothetical protein